MFKTKGPSLNNNIEFIRDRSCQIFQKKKTKSSSNSNRSPAPVYFAAGRPSNSVDEDSCDGRIRRLGASQRGRLRFQASKAKPYLRLRRSIQTGGTGVGSGGGGEESKDAEEEDTGEAQKKVPERDGAVGHFVEQLQCYAREGCSISNGGAAGREVKRERNDVVSRFRAWRRRRCSQDGVLYARRASFYGN